MMYPIPFAKPSGFARRCSSAARLRFGAGNDHDHPAPCAARVRDAPELLRATLAPFAYRRARTTRVKVCTCILVLPMRHVVAAAKRATPDQLSGGRLIHRASVSALPRGYEALFPTRAP
jgi:alkanesulfonate monooxygenase SsuD/methylene tetrahydromethanopterin reductase-like flavin-dependent oxidoreductase (luciferase family)